MRIQNNITAMNTHRMYTINNENVAKNAEKLSSGYRINRAGDDAAGLAISEKMRSQIRGLNMATKNSQDAISLVQTAEGALQETQNMLQRMNELAVQAATGTNENLDRTALAREFEQLKREINDIAEQTNFNNMTILDGSLSYEGYKRSAATAGITMTESLDRIDVATMSTDYKMGSDQVLENDAKGGVYTIGDTDSAMGQVSVKGAIYELTVNDADGNAVGTIKAVGDGSTNVNELLTKPTNAKVWAKDGQEVKGDLADTTDKWKKVAVNGGGLQFTQVDGKTLPDPGSLTATLTVTPSLSTTTLSQGTDATEDGYYTDDTGKMTINITSNVTTSNAAPKLGKDKGETIDATSVTGVDYTVNIAGTELSVKGDGAKTIGELIVDTYGAAGIDITTKDGEEVHFSLSAGTSTGDLKLEADGMTGKVLGSAAFSISAKVAEQSVDFESTVDKVAMPAGDAKASQNTVNIDWDKMSDGDTIKLNGKTYTYKGGSDGSEGTTFGDLKTLVKTITRNDTGIAASADKKGNLIVKEAIDDTTTPGTQTRSGANVRDITLTVGDKSTPKTTTMEVDFAKLQAGDEVKITVGSGKDAKSITIKKEIGEARGDFMDKIQDELTKAGIESSQVKGNAIITKGQPMSAELTADGLKDKATNAVRIQVGALENEQLSISIDAMNTKGLGLDDAHLLSTDNPEGAATIDQDAAGAAITATRNAINKVSDQRATLGAMQNRLDHKIANLKVASENLSASESRIRDVDMASEMTQFTKNNILSQAATAMLAQANSLPQNVLSLLG